MGKYEMINLEELFNNKGISRMNNPQDANFTGFGSSYISENLPSSRSVLELYGVPFLFPNKDPLVVDNLVPLIMALLLNLLNLWEMILKK